MSFRLSTQKSGRDTYEQHFVNDLEAQAAWLDLTAGDKVDSIEQLLAAVGCIPDDVMELGAGSGAVISLCKRRGLATRYIAVDYSTAALAHLASTDSTIRTIQADITEPPPDVAQGADAIVLTHVLEHLEEPGEFLRAVVKNVSFGHIVIEVPLEDLPASRAKALVKDRAKNLAGHVQFFTSKSVEKLVEEAGLVIESRRNYVPIPSLATLRFLHRKDRNSTVTFVQQLATRRYMPLAMGPLWRRFYYAHHAMVCTKA